MKKKSLLNSVLGENLDHDKRGTGVSTICSAIRKVMRGGRQHGRHFHQLFR